MHEFKSAPSNEELYYKVCSKIDDDDSDFILIGDNQNDLVKRTFNSNKPNPYYFKLKDSKNNYLKVNDDYFKIKPPKNKSDDLVIEFTLELHDMTLVTLNNNKVYLFETN